MTGIPLDKDELIQEVTVTRHKKRIHTASKPICLPLPPAPKHSDTAPHTPECERDGDVYSDAEEAELLPATCNRERKGPSRSVSVHPSRSHIYSTTDKTLDTDRRVARVQRRIFRQDTTGGEGEFTQWVHCEFFVSPETICPVVTQQVRGEFF